MIPNVKNEYKALLNLDTNLDNAYPAMELRAMIRIREPPVTFTLLIIYPHIFPSLMTFIKFSKVGAEGREKAAWYF